MEQERRPTPTDLTGVYINLVDHTIEFEDRYGTVGRLVFTGAMVLYEGQPLFVSPDTEPDVRPSTTPSITDPEDLPEGRWGGVRCQDDDSRA